MTLSRYRVELSNEKKQVHPISA